MNSMPERSIALNSLSVVPPVLDGSNIEATRKAIRNYFHSSYDLFEALFTLFEEPTYYLQSEPTRQPMIFYFGHTAVFFINKLYLAKVIAERIDPEFEKIFAVGVDEMQWDDLQKQHYNWPTVEAVQVYRDRVRHLVDRLILELPLHLPVSQDDPFWAILMGIDHERIHIETSSVLHRQMGIEKITPNKMFAACEAFAPAPKNSLVAIQGATIHLGKSTQQQRYFGWDNEYGSHIESVEAFEAGKYLVSNGEFLPFVEAGGYEQKRYWSDEGWEFITSRQIKHPPFWVKKASSWYWRSLMSEYPLPLNFPVEVSALEAQAFCAYLSEEKHEHYRLPSEAEWYAIAQASNVSEVMAQGNSNFSKYASSVPVNWHQFGELFDVTGNVWQWTQSAIDGFDGFRPHPLYDDFSTPTFDGKHNLMKGGSWASTGNELLFSSRYAFRRHFYQHAGFRYIKAKELAVQEQNIYESDELVAQYCEFQYGQTYFNVPNFATACVSKALEYVNASGSALDLGCATGRASFELAHHFSKVTGIDFSANFIKVGVQMQQQGTIRYRKKIEGEISEGIEIHAKDIGIDEVLDKVEFWQGDACNLKAHFTGYDLVLATNLIDRLYEPKQFLEDISGRIVQEGYLILTSPYTWQESSTPKASWLGGYYDETGKAVKTIDALTLFLGEAFTLVATEDIPFVIAETARKHQHTIAQMSIWKKR